MSLLNKKKKFRIMNKGTKTVSWILVDDLPFDSSDLDEIHPISSKLNSHYTLLILPKAANAIFKHIGWGYSNCSFNQIEQGGLLIGKLYQLKDQSKYFCVVESSIEGIGTQGSLSYLKMTAQTWKQMLEQYDKEKNHDNELKIIGWYHTHPNNLDVFFSSIDKNTQENWFYNDWNFGIVLNPHKKKWALFRGKECVESDGVLYTEKVHCPSIDVKEENEKIDEDAVVLKEESVGIERKSSSFLKVASVFLFLTTSLSLVLLYMVIDINEVKFISIQKELNELKKTSLKNNISIRKNREEFTLKIKQINQKYYKNKVISVILKDAFKDKESSMLNISLQLDKYSALGVIKSRSVDLYSNAEEAKE